MLTAGIVFGGQIAAAMLFSHFRQRMVTATGIGAVVVVVVMS